MTKVIGVRFRTAGKIYFFDPGDNQELKRDSHVIVETSRGIEYGTVVGEPRDVDDSKVTQPLKPILRVANERDDEQEEGNKKKEKEAFDIKGVCDSLCKKLIYRHPHVFGDAQADTAKKVEQSWEQLKLKEKGGNKTVLEGVPASLPSVVKAHRMQDKARNVGFDWEQREQVWDKVLEEFTELKDEINKMDSDKMENEFGDLFFSLINAARLYKINPDNALERTNQKFLRRFNYLESQTIQQGRSLKDMSLDEMDKIWDEAKAMGM